jgi:hypothetical protein
MGSQVTFADQVVDASTAVAAARELPRIASLIILYQRALDEIQRFWKSTDIQTLRLKVEENFPPAATLPIWLQLYEVS